MKKICSCRILYFCLLKVPSSGLAKAPKTMSTFHKNIFGRSSTCWKCTVFSPNSLLARVLRNFTQIHSNN